MTQTSPTETQGVNLSYSELENSVNKSLNTISQSIITFVEHKLKEVDENTTVKQLGDIRQALKLLETMNKSGDGSINVEEYRTRYLFTVTKHAT